MFDATQRRFWTPQRLHRVAAVLLFAVCLSVLLVAIQDSDSSSLVWRGDFPGFYGPAVMVWRGLGASLYDYDLQGRIQNEFWPGFAGGFYISVYPPHLAVLLAPLALLPATVAKLLATLVMGVCAYLAFRAARLFSHESIGGSWSSVVFFLCTPPLLVAFLSAQNTGATMLLCALIVATVRKDGFYHSTLLGCLAGLLLYKPQFGLLVLAFLTLQRGYGVLVGAAPVALLWYLLGVAAVGTTWPQKLLEAGSRFGAINADLNFKNLVSLHVLLRWLLSDDKPVTFWITAISSVGIVFALSLLLLHSRKGSVSFQQRSLCVAFAAIPLLFPQTLFYDLGISFVALLPFLEFRSDRSISIAFGCGVILALLVGVRDLISVPIFSLVALAVLLFVVGRVRPYPVQFHHGS